MGICRSTSTGSSATCTRPRWSAGTARSTGSACRASTRRRCSRRSSTTARAGASRSRATGEATTRQMYVPDTNVLITRFVTPDGVAEVYDCMPIEVGRAGHAAARPRPRAGRSTACAAPSSWSCSADRPSTTPAPAHTVAASPARLHLHLRRERSAGSRPRSACWRACRSTIEDGAARARFTVKEGEWVGVRAGVGRTAITRRRRCRRRSRCGTSSSRRSTTGSAGSARSHLPRTLARAGRTARRWRSSC